MQTQASRTQQQRSTNIVTLVVTLVVAAMIAFVVAQAFFLVRDTIQGLAEAL